jgi:hypothetical protein
MPGHNVFERLGRFCGKFRRIIQLVLGDIHRVTGTIAKFAGASTRDLRSIVGYAAQAATEVIKALTQRGMISLNCRTIGRSCHMKHPFDLGMVDIDPALYHADSTTAASSVNVTLPRGV